MRIGSKRLAVQRLAQDVIRRRDRDAAIVLGEYQQENRLPYIETGRTRLAPFEMVNVRSFFYREPGRDPFATHAAQRVMTVSELEWYDRIRTIQGRSDPAPFKVVAKERLYNLDHMAASRKVEDEAWRAVFTQWVTPRRAVYEALVRYGLLPRSIRFTDLEWVDVMGRFPGSLLHYALYLARQRPRTPRVFLMRVRRIDDPHTYEEYPGRYRTS